MKIQHFTHWRILAPILILALALVVTWPTTPPVEAQSESLPKPEGVNVQTTDGSLDVSVTWNAVFGAESYRVRLREAGDDKTFNTVATPTVAAADITVDDFGDWVVRVEACGTDGGCGRGQAVAFSVTDAQDSGPSGTAGLMLDAPGNQIYAVDSSINAFSLPVASGGTAPYTYELSVLPSGLSFAPDTRRLWGTPMEETASAVTVTYSVTDADSATAEDTFTITVEPLPYLIWDRADSSAPTGLSLWNDCVNEGESTRAHMLSLERAPTADVTVTLVNLHQRQGPQYGGLITVSPTTLTFTTTNWDTPQDITFTASQDADAEDPDTQFEAQVRSDDHRFNFSTFDLDICGIDDESPGIELSATSLTINEGSTGTYTIQPETKPLGKVRIKVTVVSTSDAVASVNPRTVEFAHDDWETAKTITVTLAGETGTNDGSATISHVVEQVVDGGILKSDPDYLDQAIPDVNITEMDTGTSGTEGDDAETTESSESEPLSLSVSSEDRELVWTRGVAFSEILPAANGGTGAITYSLNKLPAGVTFDPNTQTVSGTPTVKSRQWTFLTYKATDSATPPDTTQVTLLYLVRPNIQIPAIPDLEFTAGQDIGVVQLPTATGCDGCAYLVWPRPKGIRKNGTTLLGTPTEPTNGPFVATYTATDDAGYSESIQFRITVNPPVRVSGGSVPSFSVGTAISPPYQLAAATGGTGAITYSLSREDWSLPTGITFDPATRSLSGTPTHQTDRYWMWYQATDEMGSTYRERVWLGVD